MCVSTVWYTMPLADLNAYIRDWYTLYELKPKSVVPNLTIYMPIKTLCLEGDLNVAITSNSIELRDKFTVVATVTDEYVVLELKWLRFITPEQKIRKLQCSTTPRKMPKTQD